MHLHNGKAKTIGSQFLYVVIGICYYEVSMAGEASLCGQQISH